MCSVQLILHLPPLLLANDVVLDTSHALKQR